jgi:hypothetical protein
LASINIWRLDIALASSHYSFMKPMNPDQRHYFNPAPRLVLIHRRLIPAWFIFRYTLLLSVAWCSLLAAAQQSEPAVIAARESASLVKPDQLRLQDFQPRSIFNIPRTRVEKARFPVIDVHSHPYAKTEADVDRWARTMDDVGIAKTVVMTGETGKRFDQYVALYRRHPDRFDLWCGIDYSGSDQPGFGAVAIAELERCVKAGAVGVGELSDKGGGLRGNSGGMHLDDARMDSILDGNTNNVSSTAPTWDSTPTCIGPLFASLKLRMSIFTPRISSRITGRCTDSVCRTRC